MWKYRIIASIWYDIKYAGIECSMIHLRSCECCKSIQIVLGSDKFLSARIQKQDSCIFFKLFFHSAKTLVPATKWLQLIVGLSFAVISAKKLLPPYPTYTFFFCINGKRGPILSSSTKIIRIGGFIAKM